MEVHDAHDLRRALSEPSVFLVHARVDADEVHAGEVCRLTVGIHGPVDVDGRAVAGIGLVVGISVCELVEGEVVSDAAQIECWPRIKKYLTPIPFWGSRVPLNVIWSSLTHFG